MCLVGLLRYLWLCHARRGLMLLAMLFQRTVAVLEKDLRYRPITSNIGVVGVCASIDKRADEMLVTLESWVFNGQVVDTWTDTTSLMIPRAFINPGSHSSLVKCIRVWRSPSGVADSALGIA